ncbi:MAG TPA: 5-methyltetrahydropteroyltriglutamate--homocysteine S-methyltransferase [Acetobacteraceae bacterium]|nr:5-methyltetrahydropteroyltriglutamate--homocysteine S-methyltransferase [Acetobacteraceae bacterium]
MSLAANLGFPRIGRRRELKFALERHWRGEISEEALEAEAARLSAEHWRLQAACGIAHVPSSDFSLYDGVLDTALMFGAIPPGYGWSGGKVGLVTMFALARGSRGTKAERAAGIAPGLPALEMTKWFDTNYHYLVPLLAAGQQFELTANRPLALYREALAAGVTTRPVLLGPVSFLALGKSVDGSSPLARLDALLPLYAEVLRGLAAAGCEWVQMDEPALALDLPDATRAAFVRAYGMLAAGPTPKMMLASYFAPLADNLPTALGLPVAGLHLDLVRGRADLEPCLAAARPDLWLSLGVVDGRNVWRTDLARALAVLRRAAETRAERLMVAPSCSLLHVPMDLALEAGERSTIGLELRGWLAFAVQKLEEVATLVRGLEEGDAAIAPLLARSGAVARSRAASLEVHDAAVTERMKAATPEMERRTSGAAVRQALQRARLSLPAFPTTTIGSLPQTDDVRHMRAALARGEIDRRAYEGAIEGWTREAIAWQEQLGVDVLVHGEFERNDMVKYFAEQMRGFAFTRHGWVQSYGSRCVAPPIIWGDVSRPAPMTVRWAKYAQSLTKRPVKGMLTGPVTMLQWSFVRDDIPRELVCRQIALALRGEVLDLEAGGIAVVQVDEPAFREGLPLRKAERETYLDWAVRCFRLTTSGVRDETSIHTHMCYAEFNDIMPAIAAMDADVISIEATRSRMELLGAFREQDYPNGIGPGVWDVHSPRVPTVEEIKRLLNLARGRLAGSQIWVNPDCGLKTRGWDEVRAGLANMVAAAASLRSGPGATAGR